MQKTAKKRPVDPAKAALARRKRARERKAKQRAARDPELARAQKLRETLACLDWDQKLAPHIHPVEHGEHKGCWLWRGGYHISYSQVRPVVRAGEYGRHHADVAVWLVHHGRTYLPRGSFLKRVCGNLRCVSPHEGHALNTNRTVENEKKRRALRGDHGDLREKEQGPEGLGSAGRLPRAV